MTDLKEGLIDTDTAAAKIVQGYAAALNRYQSTLNQRVALRRDIESAEQTIALVEAQILVSGKIDGKNEQTRAAQLLLALEETSAAQLKQSLKIDRSVLGQLDGEILVAEAELTFLREQLRYLTARASRG